MKASAHRRDTKVTAWGPEDNFFVIPNEMIICVLDEEKILVEGEFTLRSDP